MSTFTERPEELTPELREAREWLRAEVERAAVAKGLRLLRWQLLYGQRRGGGTGGVPHLSQWGFQVTGIDAATGEALPLHCFLEEATVTDSPDLARRIVDLWTDRVETGGYPSEG